MLSPKLQPSFEYSIKVQLHHRAGPGKAQQRPYNRPEEKHFISFSILVITCPSSPVRIFHKTFPPHVLLGCWLTMAYLLAG